MQISSKLLQIKIIQLFNCSINTWFYKSFFLLDGRWYWLGASDRAVEGTWRWESDSSPFTPFTEMPWGGGQPDNAGGVQDCAVLWQSVFNLDDQNCDNDLNYYICQHQGSLMLQN